MEAFVGAPLAAGGAACRQAGYEAPWAPGRRLLVPRLLAPEVARRPCGAVPAAAAAVAASAAARSRRARRTLVSLRARAGRALAADPDVPLTAAAASVGPLYVVAALRACAASFGSAQYTYLLEEVASGQAGARQVLVWLQVANTVTDILAALIIGPWSDRVGRRTPMLLCTAALLLENVLLAITHSLPMLFAGQVFVGAISTAYASVGQSCVADAVRPDDRARVFARLSAVGSVSSIVVTLIGGLVAGRYGIRAPFWLGGGVGGIALTSMYCCLPEYFPGADVGGGGADVGVGIARGGMRGLRPAVQTVLQRYWQMLEDAPALRWFLASTIVLSFGYGVIGATLVFWVREVLSGGPSAMSFFMSFLSGAGFVAQIGTLPLLQRWLQGRDYFLAMGCLLLNAMQFGLYSVAREAWHLYAIVAVSVVASCGSSIQSGLVSSCVGRQNQGLLNGSFTAIGGLASIAGLIASRRMRGGAPMLVMALCCALAALFVARAAPAGTWRFGRRRAAAKT